MGVMGDGSDGNGSGGMRSDGELWGWGVTGTGRDWNGARREWGMMGMGSEGKRDGGVTGMGSGGIKTRGKGGGGGGERHGDGEWRGWDVTGMGSDGIRTRRGGGGGRDTEMGSGGVGT